MTVKSDFYYEKKVMITGHTGFKGTWLTFLLLKLGADICGYSLPPPTKPNMFSETALKKRILSYEGDIRDYRKILNFMEKEQPEIVFHLAAQPLVLDSYKMPLYTYETNLMGTVNLLEAIRYIPSVRCAVIITTDKVYENREWIWPYRENDTLGGHDPYASSKACAEIAVSSYIKSFFPLDKYNLSHHILIATARSGNVIGGGDWNKYRLIPDIVRNIFEKESIIEIRSPDAVRPWQFVLEPIYGYILLAEQLYHGKKEYSGAWNFSAPDSNFITVEELVKKSISILKKGKYRVCKSHKPETRLLMLDSTKARAYLHWYPLLSLDEALKWTFEWYQRYYCGQDIVSLTEKQIDIFLERYGRR